MFECVCVCVCVCVGVCDLWVVHNRIQYDILKKTDLISMYCVHRVYYENMQPYTLMRL